MFRYENNRVKVALDCKKLLQSKRYKIDENYFFPMFDSYFKTSLSLFHSCYLEQKIGKKNPNPNPDRDKLMQNRFKIVFRTEENSVKIALHCKKLLQ